MGFLNGKTAIITGAGFATLSDGRCGSIGYGIATAYATPEPVSRIAHEATSASPLKRSLRKTAMSCDIFLPDDSMTHEVWQMKL